MSICIHIPFYNPEPEKPEGYRKLRRYDYLKENIINLQQLSKTVDIFVHTHNSFLDDKKINVKVVKHNLDKNSLDRGFLTWETRNYMKKFVHLYKYFIYIEHDIKFTKKNLDYWKHYKKFLKNKNFNLGFLIFEKNNEKKEKYSIHLANKFDKILQLKDQEFIINDVENYCCFWIYEKEVFKKFINSKWWNLNLVLTNYRHKYGNTEKAALGLHALNTKYFKSTLIPLIDNKIDQRCFIEHMTNNYFYMFKNEKFIYSDIRGACRFKINDLIVDRKKIKYYNKFPITLNFKKKIYWKFRFLNKILRLVKKLYD